MLILFALFACSHRVPGPAVAGDPAQLATFEAVYARISETYPYADFRGVDWAGAYERLLPRAEAARTADELRPVLTELLATLGESHFAILPGSYAALNFGEEGGGDGTPGLELRWVDDALLAFRVGERAAQAGLSPGDEVVSIGATPVAEALAEPGAMPLPTYAALWSARRLSGGVGTELRLVVRGEDGVQTERSVTRGPAPGEPTQMGFLPTVITDFEAKALGENAGYIRFNAFMTSIADPFRDAVMSFAGRAGIVVDVRGNLGGVAGLANGLAGYFIHESGKEMGRLITREGELHLFIFPRPPAQRYTGKLAILVDEASFSTAEIFAAGLQALGRARVFGAPSPGMALPSRIEALPNGDALQYAFADFYDPLGRRVEGKGAIPDTPVPLSRAALRSGRDPVIDAAECWIQNKEGACP